MPLKIGTIVDGRYRVDARVGHGGMAEVYEAHDVITKETVAIKLILENLVSNPVNLRRFENEATIAASLSHPNIVKVLNHGTIGGIPYIANEFIYGQNLKQVLDFQQCLSIEEAVEIMIQLTDALQYAHKHLIIHRDVKPDNIFLLVSDNTIKLSDFGIAVADGVDSANNNSNDVVGSIHYMAPELSEGKQATIQSDIYAAGVTFFELITGHVPFEYSTVMDIALAAHKEKFPSPKKYLPKCSDEIERIIYKATKKKAKDRYKSAAEFNADLKEVKKHPELLKGEKRSFIARLFGFK